MTEIKVLTDASMKALLSEAFERMPDDSPMTFIFAAGQWHAIDAPVQFMGIPIEVNYALSPDVICVSIDGAGTGQRS